MRIIGIFNRDGGTFRTMDIEAFVARARQVFAVHGHELEARVVAGSDLIAALAVAATDDRADIVLAGGGDGTASAAAAVCFDAGKALAVLPAGTMNLFARTLRMPLNLDEAVAALAAGRLYDIDIATANARSFVHQYSVGVHARLVRIRERMPYRNRLEKMSANVKAVAGAVSRPLRFHVEIETAGGPQEQSASGVFVTNNLFGEGHFPFADRLDDGILGVYVVAPLSKWQLVRLLIRAAIGRWRMKAVSEHRVTHLTLKFPRRKHTDQAAIDGELVPLEREVHLMVHPRALRVFAPQALEGAMASSAATK